MKFNFCVDNSEYIQNAIKESISGNDVWEGNAVFDHATKVKVKDSEDYFNVIHTTGSVLTFLKYKLMYLRANAWNGCYAGWDLK